MHGKDAPFPQAASRGYSPTDRLWGGGESAMQHTANTLENHWMPFTANRDFKAEPRLLVKGEGVYYWNHQGQRVLDGTAGLFCSALGHGRKRC